MRLTFKLINLVVKGIQSMNGGCILSLGTEKARKVNPTEPSGELMQVSAIYVQDRGPGIANDALPTESSRNIVVGLRSSLQDVAMCTMLKSPLAQRGFYVEAHGNTEDAFTALRSDDFDVVITDLNMRGMNGQELCERIAADRPDVPVERSYITRVLETCDGNKTAAAKVLGLDRTTLYRKLERYGLSAD